MEAPSVGPSRGVRPRVGARHRPATRSPLCPGAVLLLVILSSLVISSCPPVSASHSTVPQSGHHPHVHHHRSHHHGHHRIEHHPHPHTHQRQSLPHDDDEVIASEEAAKPDTSKLVIHADSQPGSSHRPSSKKQRSVPQIGQFVPPGHQHQFGQQSPSSALQPHVWHHDEIQSLPEADSDIEEADPLGEDDDPEELDFAKDDLDLHPQTTASSVSNDTLYNTTGPHYLTMLKHFTNLTRETGDTVRLKCEFSGNPIPKVTWYKNEAPIEPEKGKIIIKSSRVRDHNDRIRARLIINRLDTHDIGFYKCEASNGFKTLDSIGVLIVKADNVHQASTSFPSPDYLDPAFSYPNPGAGVPGPVGAFGGKNTLIGHERTRTHFTSGTARFLCAEPSAAVVLVQSTQKSTI